MTDFSANKDREMTNRTPLVPRNSECGKDIQQASGWLELALADMDKIVDDHNDLYKQPMQGDGHKILSSARDNARKVKENLKIVQEWLDATNVPDRQPPLIESRKLLTRKPQVMND